MAIARVHICHQRLRSWGARLTMSCMGGITHTHLHPMCVAALPSPHLPPPHHHHTLAHLWHRFAWRAMLCVVPQCPCVLMVCVKGRGVCTRQINVWMRAVSGVSGRRHAQTMMWYLWQANHIRGSIVVSISACHADDPGSIPGRGVGTLTPCACGVAAMICSALTRPGLEPGISGSGGRRLIH